MIYAAAAITLAVTLGFAFGVFFFLYKIVRDDLNSRM